MYDPSKHNRRSVTICILGGKVFAADGVIDDGCVLVRDGLVAGVGERSGITVPADAEIIDASDKRIIPGLIDLHIHGFVGQDVVGGDIRLMSEALAQRGITSFVASVAAARRQEMIDAVEHLLVSDDALPGAKMVGIHLEGPYLSAQHAGALNPQYFRLPNRNEMAELLHVGRGKIRIVTIAPELEGALDMIAWLSSQGVVPAIGHSDASYEQVASAVKHGLRHATHAFNAMRQFHHREPGAVGAVLSLDEITAEVIADGYHLHPAAIRLVMRLKGVERACLVSDAMPLAGLAPGVYGWLGQEVVVDSTTARLQTGALAGSIVPLNIALKNLVDITALPLEEMLITASSTPARVLSLNRGAIRVGKNADIVVLDDTFGAWLTVVQGNVVHRANRLNA